MPPELWLYASMAGILGLLLGSFLNVCSLRWPVDESVVTPPSRCPGCGEGVKWYDNIPVLSWIVLRGRCRSCRKAISVQYPLVEAAMGLIWAGMVVQHGVGLEAFHGAIFLTLLLGIALSDARFYIIPDQFSLGGLVVGLALAPVMGGVDGLVIAGVGAVAGFFLLWGVGVLGKLAFKKEAMGGGDIKMMAMVGAFLGLPGVLLTIFLGALVGSVIFGPISLRTGKLVPFGIFLAVGGGVAYGWGDALVAWYLAWVFGT